MPSPPHIQYTSALSGQPAHSCSNLFIASILCSPAAYGASIKALIAILFVCYSFAHVFMSRKNETTFSVQINCVSCHGHTGRFMDWLDIASCRYGWGSRVLISKYSGCTRDREGRRSRRRNKVAVSTVSLACTCIDTNSSCCRAVVNDESYLLLFLHSCSMWSIN